MWFSVTAYAQKKKKKKNLMITPLLLKCVALNPMQGLFSRKSQAI